MDQHGRTGRVNRASPIPAYHQIFTDLNNRILGNEWLPNDKLPTEKELGEHYSASRVTVRQALSALEQMGIIKKVKGSGSIVQKREESIIHDFSLPSTLCAKLGQRGINLDAEILELKICAAVPHINSLLQLGADASLVHIRRVFLHSARPIALNDSWIAASFLPGIVESGLIDGHLSTTLAQRYELIPSRIQNTLEAVRASTAEIKLLDIPFDTPIIAVTSTSYLPYGVPLEYSRTLWLADRVKFHFDMDNRG